MKVLLFLADGVELMEASPFIDVFGWHNHYNEGDIQVVTCAATRRLRSTFGLKIEADVELAEMEAADYEALILPGGFAEYGFYETAYREDVLELIRTFERRGKWIATVCVGALPLGKSGILQGKPATTYHLMGGRRQAQLAEFGAEIRQEPVVTTERIITSWCPATAPEVAFQLLEALTDSEAAGRVRTWMGF